jgi:hypothetical protein
MATELHDADLIDNDVLLHLRLDNHLLDGDARALEEQEVSTQTRPKDEEEQKRV